MRVRSQVSLPHPAHQLSERRVTRHVGPQHQRVHEEPDQLIQRRVTPPGDRRAQRDIVARRRSRDSSTASAACTTMNNVARPARATSTSPACTSAPTSTGTAPPRCDGVAGRGRSAGSGISAGDPGQRLPPVPQLSRRHAVQVVFATRAPPRCQIA